MSTDEKIIEYYQDRLKAYIMLEKIYGHERACRILRLYDLKEGWWDDAFGQKTIYL